MIRHFQFLRNTIESYTYLKWEFLISIHTMQRNFRILTGLKSWMDKIHRNI
jgi:hypothetical protein